MKIGISNVSPLPSSGRVSLCGLLRLSEATSYSVLESVSLISADLGIGYRYPGSVSGVVLDEGDVGLQGLSAGELGDPL